MEPDCTEENKNHHNFDITHQTNAPCQEDTECQKTENINGNNNNTTTVSTAIILKESLKKINLYLLDLAWVPGFL